jgi:hypothetical protein
MSSNKLVVSKESGFGMLAKHLSETLGYPFDKKQAQNKFAYLERKFHAAKTWQRTSGVGITDEDRARGLSCNFLLLKMKSHAFQQASATFLPSSTTCVRNLSCGILGSASIKNTIPAVLWNQ